MKRLLLIGSLVFGFGASAQEINGGPVNVQGDVIDGVYIKEHIPTKRMIPYEFVREADVVWSKRVWRVIDMREKINLPIDSNNNKPICKTVMPTITAAAP